MSDIKPVAWTSKKGIRYLAKMGFLSIAKMRDRERDLPLYGPEAAAEIAHLRQLLSEAEKREKEAREKALEETARLVDAKADAHEKEARDLRGGDRDRRSCISVATRLRGTAEDIRALQSEER